MQNQGQGQQQHQQQHQQYPYGGGALPAGGIASGTATGVPPFNTNQLPSIHSYLHNTPTSTSNFAPVPSFAPQAQQSFIPPNLAAAHAANQNAQWQQSQQQPAPTAFQTQVSSPPNPLVAGFSPNLGGAAFGGSSGGSTQYQQSSFNNPFQAVQPTSNSAAQQFPQTLPANASGGLQYGVQFPANQFMQSTSPPAPHHQQQLFPDGSGDGSHYQGLSQTHVHQPQHAQQQSSQQAAPYPTQSLYGAAEFGNLGSNNQQSLNHSVPVSSAPSQWDGNYPQPPQPGQLQSISQTWQQHAAQSTQPQAVQPHLQQQQPPQPYSGQGGQQQQNIQEAPQKFGSISGDPQAAFYATVTPPPPAAPKPQRPATSAQFFAATAAAVSSPGATSTPPPHAHSLPNPPKPPKDTKPQEKPVATASGFGAGGFVGWEVYTGDEDDGNKGKVDERQKTQMSQVGSGGGLQHAAAVEMPAKTPPVPSQPFVNPQFISSPQASLDGSLTDVTQQGPPGGVIAQIGGQDENPWATTQSLNNIDFQSQPIPVAGPHSTHAEIHHGSIGNSGILSHQQQGSRPGSHGQGQITTPPQHQSHRYSTHASPLSHNLNAPEKQHSIASTAHTPNSVTSIPPNQIGSQTISPKPQTGVDQANIIPGCSSSSPGNRADQATYAPEFVPQQPQPQQHHQQQQQQPPSHGFIQQAPLIPQETNENLQQYSSPQDSQHLQFQSPQQQQNHPVNHRYSVVPEGGYNAQLQHQTIAQLPTQQLQYQQPAFVTGLGLAHDHTALSPQNNFYGGVSAGFPVDSQQQIQPQIQPQPQPQAPLQQYQQHKPTTGTPQSNSANAFGLVATQPPPGHTQHDTGFGHQPPPVASSIFIGEPVHTTPSPFVAPKSEEPKKFVEDYIPADLDKYYVDSIHRYVAMIKLEAVASSDIERLRIFNQFIDDEYRRRGAKYPDAICVDPVEISKKAEPHSQGTPVWRRQSSVQSAQDFNKSDRKHSLTGDDSPLAKAIADLEGDFDSISLAAAAEKPAAAVEKDIHAQNEPHFKPRPLSVSRESTGLPSPPIQPYAPPSYQPFSPPLEQRSFSNPSDRNSTQFENKRASIAHERPVYGAASQVWNANVNSALPTQPFINRAPSSEDQRVESTLAKEAKQMVENRQKFNAPPQDDTTAGRKGSTGDTSAYTQRMYMEAGSSNKPQRRATPRSNTAGLPDTLIAGPVFNTAPEVAKTQTPPRDVQQENVMDDFVVVPSSISPENFSRATPPSKPPVAVEKLREHQIPAEKLVPSEPVRKSPVNSKPAESAPSKAERNTPSQPPPHPVAPSQPPPNPVASSQPPPNPVASSQPPPNPVASSQPPPNPVAPSQAAPTSKLSAPSTTPSSASAGIAALSAVLGAGRKVRPAKSRALEPIRKQLETIGTDVSFVEESMKKFDASAKKIRDKNEAERDKEKTEHDDYYDDLYNAKKITYEDLRDAEEEIVLRMNERKDQEETDEFNRYISEVFTPTYTKLQERIGYLKTEYTKAVHFTKIASAGKQKYEDVASQPELLDTLSLLVELFDAIEVQNQALQKVLTERAKRYKSTVLNPLYRDHSSNKVETLRNMRKHFEDDDNKAALDASQEALYRARSLMSTVRECMESGLNLEIGFFHEIQPVLVATLEQLPEDLKSYSGDVGHLHNEVQYAFDVLKALTETQNTMMKVFHKANKSLNLAEQNFDVCNAKNKGHTADEVKEVISEKEEQSKVLDDELNERLEHINGYFSGVRDNVFPHLTKLKKFLGIPQAE